MTKEMAQEMTTEISNKRNVVKIDPRLASLPPPALSSQHSLLLTPPSLPLLATGTVNNTTSPGYYPVKHPTSVWPLVVHAWIQVAKSPVTLNGHDRGNNKSAT